MGLYPLTYLSAGSVLLFAVIVLWRKDIEAMVYAVSLQGITLSAVGILEALSKHNLALGQVGIETLILKGFIFPYLMFKIYTNSGSKRDTEPLINTTASMVYASIFIAIPFFAIGRLPYVSSTPITKLAPLGFATLLVGLFIIITRRQVISQIVGLIVFENGISLISLLILSGLPLMVEFGESFDLLLVIVVLRVLATTIHKEFGNIDLAEMKGLHD